MTTFLNYFTRFTDLPDFLYKKEMVVISYENLNDVYSYLMIKVIISIVLGFLTPYYVTTLLYNTVTNFIARRKLQNLKMEIINFCEDDDSEDEDYSLSSSDISDAESNYDDYDDEKQNEILNMETVYDSGSDISLKKVTKMLIDDEFSNVYEPVDYPRKSQLYQSARRNKICY